MECLTKDVESWNEPKEKLQTILEKLKPYYNQEVFLWGGGGPGVSKAILVKAEICPAIFKNHTNHTLKVYLTQLDPPIAGDTEFDPYIGSWQISAKPQP